MLKNSFLPSSLLYLFLFFFSGVKYVKDSIDESIAAFECANLVVRIEEDGNNQKCAEQIADIDKILNTCNEFLSQ